MPDTWCAMPNARCWWCATPRPRSVSRATIRAKEYWAGREKIGGRAAATNEITKTSRGEPALQKRGGGSALDAVAPARRCSRSRRKLTAQNLRKPQWQGISAKDKLTDRGFWCSAVVLGALPGATTGIISSACVH